MDFRMDSGYLPFRAVFDRTFLKVWVEVNPSRSLHALRHVVGGK